MKNIFSKINPYQMVVFCWGAFALVGYLLQDHFMDPNIAIITWTLVIAAASFVQIYFFWSESKRIKLLNILWVKINVIGGILTYLLWTGTIFPDAKINVMWFVLIALGMIATGIIIKMKKYFVLAIIYLIFAVIFQMLNFEHDLIFSGIAFLAVNVLDGVWG